MDSQSVLNGLKDFVSDLDFCFLNFFLNFIYFLSWAWWIALPTTPSTDGMCWTTEQRATKKKQRPQQLREAGLHSHKIHWRRSPTKDANRWTCTTNALDCRLQQRETKATMKPTKDHWVLITPLGRQKASQALIENTSLMSKPSSSRQNNWCKWSTFNLTNALSISTVLNILMLLKGGGQRGGTIGRGQGVKNMHIHKTSFRSATPKPICCNIQACSLLSVGSGKGKNLRVINRL